MFSYLPVLPKVGYVCKIYDLAREEGVKSLGKKRKTRLGEEREAKRDGSDEVPGKIPTRSAGLGKKREQKG
jgi:hypothetical protein